MLIIDSTTRRPIETGTVVRPYSPAGFYWRQDFSCPTALYVVQDDLVFSACHFEASSQADRHYSDFDHLTLEEVRLNAALFLPIGFKEGAVSLYPLRYSLGIEERIPFHDVNAAVRLGDLLREKLESRDDQYGNMFGPCPPAFGGPSYEFRLTPSPSALQERIYDNIDIEDPILMRGLGSFVLATMVSRHHELLEAALHPMYVALDASLQMVMEKMRAAGTPNPTTTDAQAMLESAFGEPQTGMRYFEEFYEDRIRTVHPANRFGAFAYAPVRVEDFYFLHDGLRDVFRWLILGESINLESDT